MNHKVLLLYMILVLISCSDYKGDKKSFSYHTVEIIYDIGKGSDHIFLVTNPKIVNKLNQLKNKSKKKLFLNPSIKGSKFVIKLIFNDTINNKKLLITIFKDEGMEPTVVFGEGLIFDVLYQNNELLKYTDSLIQNNMDDNSLGREKIIK